MSKELFFEEREADNLPPRTTQIDVMHYLNELRGKVLNGDFEPLKAYIILKQVSALVDACITDVQDLAIDNALEYGSKSFELLGQKVDMKNAPGKWDFSEVASITKATAEKKRLEEIAKQAFKLKTEIPDPETGETISGAKYAEGRQTISITLKK